MPSLGRLGSFRAGAARLRRRARQRLLLLALASLAVACTGIATSALQVGDTTATLAGTGSCSGNDAANPCTTWFQYWQDNATTLVQTPLQQGEFAFTNSPITQAIGGLLPGGLYHYQFCGYGDTSLPRPGVCIGQTEGNFITSPGEVPPFLATQPSGSTYTYDLSATSNFATANPSAALPLAATVDLGRVSAGSDVSTYTPGAATSNAVSRDAGYSVPYGTAGQSLWMFGDTTFDCLPSQAGPDCRFAAGATVALGPYVPGQAPQTLQEVSPVPAAANTPASFFPSPTGLQFMATINGASTPANCAPASVTGSISGATLTLATPTSGAVQVGQQVFGQGLVPGTVVQQQLTGAAGQGGTYQISPGQTVANEWLFITFAGGNYTANWPRGGAQIPGSTKLLLAHEDVCIAGAGVFLSERIHLVEYDPVANQLSNDTVPFAASPLINGLNPRELLASPVFGSDGYLYLYSFTNECMSNPGCAHAPTYPNAVYAARVSADPLAMKWKSGANFEWWCGTASLCPVGPSGTPGWTGVEADAQSVVAFPSVLKKDGLRVQQGPFAQISVGNYASVSAQKYVVIAQTPPPVVGQQTEFMVFEGATPYGPFTFAKAGAVPDSCNAPTNCYAVIGHPELSTNQQLVFSWFSTDDRLDSFPYSLNGHVRLGAIDW